MTGKCYPKALIWAFTLVGVLSLLISACSPAATQVAATQPPATPLISEPTGMPTVEPTVVSNTAPTTEPVTLAPSATPSSSTTSPSASGSISLVDGLKRTVTLEKPAQRIVSLAPSNTEILFAIGAGKQLVARDDFSDYPAEAASLPSIGGSFNKFNSEAIVNLKPDLVLASELTTADQVQAFESLGLKVFMLSNPTDLEGMYQNLTTVATLTGHEAETSQLTEKLKGRVAAVEEKIKGVSTQPLVFYEIDGTDPSAPYTPGPGTFLDTLITMAGGKNLGSGLKDAYAQVSLEELVVQNPEIILLGDAVWGGVTAEAVAKRAGWEKLDAVKNNRVYPLDDNLVSRPGPRLVDGLESIAKLLHPELFQ